MRQFGIHFHSFADIREFVALAIAQPFDVMIGSGNQLVNAKSIMAMFCLDYNRPLHVSVTCDEEAFDRFTADAAKFIR